MRCDMVRRPVGRIDHNRKARQVQLVGKRAFAKFDIASGSIVDPPSAAQGPGTDQAQELVDRRFYLGQDLVGQLNALSRKELDAVVFIGIIRGTEQSEKNTSALQ